MTNEFTLQDPGEGIHEAEILEVLVSEGDTVEEGQDVLVVETDKAAIEIPSPQAGTIAKIAVSEGDIVSVGDVLLTFDNGASDRTGKSNGKDAGAPNEADESEADASGKAESEEDETEKADEAAAGGDGGEEPFETDDPSVAAKMETGDDDESTEAESGRDAEKSKVEAESDDAEPKKRRDGPVPAAPAVRRIARELNVDLTDIEGTGPDGRVTEDDVRKAGDGKEPSEDKQKRQKRAESTSQPDYARWGEVERIKLRSVRRATARRMSKAWAEIPHVAHQDRADITALEDFRKRHEAEIEEEGGALTLTVFLLKAAAAALREFPRFNASFDTETDEIVLKRYYHIGMALDSERGLLVPVFRDVDSKSVSELAVELKQLTKKARDGKAEPDDMRGGSFTLTNVGGIGGSAMMPIINHPQVAILGATQARREPVFANPDDASAGGPMQIEARLMLPLTLTFDHRVADGADAARFMNTVIETLADPEAFALAA